MKNKSGFSLIEVVITILVVGTVAAIAVPTYRSYVSRAIANEGKAVVNEINAAEQIYYARNGKFFAGSEGQQYASTIGVDARRNKYFTSYNITSTGTKQTYTAITKYKGIEGRALTIIGNVESEPTVIDNVSNKGDVVS